MSFYARPCEIHALNRICPHGDCVKVVREVDLAELVECITQAHKLLGALCGNDIHNATARDAVGAAFVHLDVALVAAMRATKVSP